LATIKVTTRVLNVTVGPLLTSRNNGSMIYQAMVDEAVVLYR
jgi:hypothetical protein